MSLIKDGKVYRTIYEQVVHLTEQHEGQLETNQEITNRLNGIDTELQNLTTISNYGGYNLVRFAFQKKGKYYKFRNKEITVKVSGTAGNTQVGDFVEFTSENAYAIPAYGFVSSVDGYNIGVTVEFPGDFLAQWESLKFVNTTRGDDLGQATFAKGDYQEFDGTSLLDYDANTRQRQVFNVMEDLAYGQPTQYVSFDLNQDGTYSFVFVGVIRNGEDGIDHYSTDGSDYDAILAKMKEGDSVLITAVEPSIPSLPDAKCGDVYQCKSVGSVEKIGNIRGVKGEKGDTGAKGDKGETGERGIQGVQGNQGVKGDKGDAGQSLNIHKGILSSSSELPQFSETKIADAYVVQNATGGAVVYDMYYHPAEDDDWSVIPNWGGVPGPKGETGAQGIQGPTGPAGPTGPEGPKGDKGEAGNQGAQGLQGKTGNTGPKGEQGTSLSNLQAKLKSSGDTGNTYELTSTLSDGSSFSSGTFVAPKGETGETGPAGPAGPAGPQGPAGVGGKLYFASGYPTNPESAVTVLVYCLSASKKPATTMMTVIQPFYKSLAGYVSELSIYTPFTINETGDTVKGAVAVKTVVGNINKEYLFDFQLPISEVA